MQRSRHPVVRRDKKLQIKPRIFMGMCSSLLFEEIRHSGDSKHLYSSKDIALKGDRASSGMMVEVLGGKDVIILSC